MPCQFRMIGGFRAERGIQLAISLPGAVDDPIPLAVTGQQDPVGRVEGEMDERADGQSARHFPGGMAADAVGDEEAVAVDFTSVGHLARRQVRQPGLPEPAKADDQVHVFVVPPN